MIARVAVAVYAEVKDAEEAEEFATELRDGLRRVPVIVGYPQIADAKVLHEGTRMLSDAEAREEGFEVDG